MLTISSEEFLECVTPSWNQFYGEGSRKTIPLHWYSRYKSQYPDPNNKNGILGSCIATLIRNQQMIEGGSSYKICRLADVDPTNFLMIEADLVNAVPKHPPVVLYPGSCRDLMSNNKSLLQAALVVPVPIGSSKNGRTPTKKSVSDFQPTDWCPSRSVFPFPAFHAHVNWELRRKGNDGDIRGFDVEVLKLRFVEYLSQFMWNTNQFLLAMFSAYGPNIWQYPVKVLWILKQRDLLRSSTKLYEYIDGEIGQQVFSPIFGPESSKIIPTKNLSPPIIPAQHESSTRPPPPPPSDDGNVSNSSQSPLSYEHWRARCEKGLRELPGDGSSSYQIPEAAYQELFLSYQRLTEGNTDPNQFPLFFLGVMTGSHLREFQIGAIPASDKEESVTGSLSPSATSGFGVGDGGVMACVHTRGRLHLDESGAHLLQNLGITILPSVESIHNSFVSHKKLEVETLERIKNEFRGEQIKDFVKELSYRICWVSDDEDLKLSAVLIGALVSLKLISKAYVIHCIRNGIIKIFPELLVKVLNVGPRLASFLAHLFVMEEDFCWFLTLTDELRTNFLPVWADLLKGTVVALRQRSSHAAVVELFSRTPGAGPFLQGI